jgi:hypothetical protein
MEAGAERCSARLVTGESFFLVDIADGGANIG